MPRFHIGQRVIIVDPECYLHGEETTIIAIHRNRWLCRTYDGKREHHAVIYGLDIPTTDPKRFAGVGLNPERLRPAYDGDTPVAWADCLWKPNGVSNR